MGRQHALLGFPDSSAGKESACNAWYSGLIPGSGSSPAEGIGYPLQYFWASLVAQMVKNLPAMRKTWVRSLGWDNSLEDDMYSCLEYSCLENPHGQRSLVGYSPQGCRVGHDWLSTVQQVSHQRTGGGAGTRGVSIQPPTLLTLGTALISGKSA